jgi:hypothetical protein
MQVLPRSVIGALITFFFFNEPTCLAQSPGAANPPQAAPAEHDAAAKQTQNPVGDIVSIPVQFSFNNGGDLKDDTFFNVNFQPVIPIHVSKEWTLLLRTIVPIDSVPGPNQVRFSGLGDVQESPLKTATCASGRAFVQVATPALDFRITTTLNAQPDSGKPSAFFVDPDISHGSKHGKEKP